MTSHDPNFFAQFACVEIQNELAGEGLEPRAVAFDDDVSSIGNNAQFRQRRLDMGNAFAQGRDRAAEAICGNAVFSELFYSAKADEVAKIVKAVSLLFAGRYEAQSIPIVQLLRREFQNALNFLAAESVGCAHEKTSRLPSFPL